MTRHPKAILLPAVAILLSFNLSFAKPSLTRTGSYVYVAPPNQSVETAKKMALERAKLQILENEFGTVVGVNNISRIEHIDGESSFSFVSVSGQRLKGNG